MTILNFPASPQDGDIYTVNGISYVYNNGAWSSNSAESNNSLYVNVDGDNMTGNLTMGGDKVELNATTGLVTATGGIKFGDDTIQTTAGGGGGGSVGSLQQVTDVGNVTTNGASFGDDVDVTGKVTSNSTVVGDSGSTLTTKDYVDANIGGGAVSKIIAGDNVTISPTTGVGEVTINSTGGGGDGTPGVRYQQGTWKAIGSAAGSGEFTMGRNYCIWTRIGNQVTLDLDLGGFSEQTSGSVGFINLPYPSANVDNCIYQGFAGDVSYINVKSGYTTPYLRISDSSSIITLMSREEASDHEPVGEGDVGYVSPLSTLRGSITYTTDDTTFIPGGTDVTKEVDIQGTGGGGSGDGSGAGADAWGFVYADGAVQGIYNATVERTGLGNYQYTFVTPMPNGNYSCLVTPSSLAGGELTCSVMNKTANGFMVVQQDAMAGGANKDGAHSFAVFATNSTPPKGTTGADAWAVTNDQAVTLASFNCSVVGNGPGIRDVTFTTPMPTSDYAVICTIDDGIGQARVVNKTTTGFRVECLYWDSTSAADLAIQFAVFATNAQLPNTVTQEQIEAAINNPGLSAWAQLSPADGLKAGNNIASATKNSDGNWTIEFINALPSENYAVTACASSNNFTISAYNKTGTGFTLLTQQDGVSTDTGVMFMVAATNALPPRGGTGADAWVVTTDGDGTVGSSFNVGSVVKNDTGKYSVIFTNPMPTASYAVQGIVNTGSVGAGTFTASGFGTGGFNVTLWKDSTNANTDFPFSLSVFATNAQLPDSFTKEEIQEILDFIDEGGTGGGSGAGADAWASVADDQTLITGHNIKSVTADSTKRAIVVFETPMPNADYAVVGSASKLPGGSNGEFSIYEDGSKTANGFTYFVSTYDGGTVNCEAYFAVFATNAIPPKGTTGTDAWGNIDDDGTITGSYNIKSVTNTATGKYQVEFTTPMPTANYSVVATTSNTNRVASVDGQELTVNGFELTTKTVDSGTNNNSQFYFTVNATNAQLPNTVTQEQIEAAINNPGASAWVSFDGSSSVNTDCTISGANNIARVAHTSAGNYTIYFINSLPNTDYAVNVSSNAESCLFINSGKGTDSFQVRTLDFDGNSVDTTAIAATVFATNALAPQYGVGADAWGTFNGDGVKQGNYNVQSVTKTGDGTYDILFTTPMPTASYSALATCQTAQRFARVAAIATTGFTIHTYTASGTITDSACNFTVHASSTITPAYTWTRDGTTLLPANDGDNVNLTGTLNVGTGNNQSYLTSNSALLVADDNYMFYSDLNAGTSRWGTRTQILNSQQNIRLSAVDGSAVFAGGMQAAAYLCRAGTNGEYGNNFNVFWSPTSQVQIWIDTSQVVTLASGTYSPTSGYFNAETNTLFGSNLEIRLETGNSANFNSSGEYTGPTLDVGDRLKKADDALKTLKVAASSATDFASLKAAIATALSNI